MATTVFLVRHGTHDRLGRVLCGRMPGVGLNAEGQAQAAKLASRLSREPIAAVYASPLQRARETAAPIAQALGLPVGTDEALNEIDLGAWTGATFDALAADPRWALWNAARGAHAPPGGESMQQVQARVAGWLDAMVARHPGQAVAAICHADVIKAALTQALGLPLDAYGRLEVSPGSLSVIVAGDWGQKLWSMNELPA